MAAPQEEVLEYEEQQEIEGGEKAAVTAPLAEVAAAAAPLAEEKKAELQADSKGYSGIHCAGFKDLLLKPELIRAISDCGFEHPSEVQHMCIPQAILGTDVLCQAKSGMGKTAVFVLSILHQLQPEKGKVQVLVLAHTRELAYQICREFARFGKYLPDITTKVVFGGVPLTENKRMLRTECPNVVVGTPGRVRDLVQQGDLNLSNVSHFVIDECDKVLDKLDMRRDVQEIFRATPRRADVIRQNRIKQVMMFSATLPKELREVCEKFMDHVRTFLFLISTFFKTTVAQPIEVFVDDEAKLTLHGLQQHYLQLLESQKTRKLTELLDALQFNQVIIFVRTVPRAIELDRILRQSNFPSICIHRDLPQETRIQRYQEFKDFKHRILVATDLFGRGIDMEKVNIVINYDMPESSDTYLHRVNRAGRFGTKGLAITFVSSKEDSEILNQ